MRLSLLAWGLGHLALGHRTTGLALLVAELVTLAALAAVTPPLIAGSAYLLPFLLGVATIAAWGAQAVAAYHAARRRAAAVGPADPRSPAAVIGWLGVPLLAWATVYWLLAAGAATPAAVLDRFAVRWERIAVSPAAADGLASDPEGLAADVRSALARLADLCRAGRIEADCASHADLVRDLRYRIGRPAAGRATANVELVRFEQRPTRFLGLFEGAERVPVTEEEILELTLTAVERGGPLGLDVGAVEWRIVGSRVR